MWYDYFCEDCKNKVIDVYQSKEEKPLSKCEVCGSHDFHRVIYAPTVFVKGEPTTIGQLAEANSKKLGKSKVEEMTGKNKSSKKNALREARAELNSQINKMSDVQKKRWIENG